MGWLHVGERTIGRPLAVVRQLSELRGSRLDAHKSVQARCVGAELRIAGGSRAGCKRVVATAAFGAAHALCLKLLHHFGLLETDRLRVEIEALQHLNEAADLDGLLRRER